MGWATIYYAGNKTHGATFSSDTSLTMGNFLTYPIGYCVTVWDY